MPKVSSSQYLTIDQVKVGDAITMYSNKNGAICENKVIGVIEAVNTKSVRIALVDTSKQSLQRVGVARTPLNAHFSIVSDHVYSLWKLKETPQQLVRCGKLNRSFHNGKLSLNITKAGELKWSACRFKRFDIEDCLSSFEPYEVWSKDEVLKSEMAKAEEEVARLLNSEL